MKNTCPECGGRLDVTLECTRCGEVFEAQVEKMHRMVRKEKPDDK
jgi:predicted  nucleic acid-binding Zn-ribbon protein